MGGNQKFLFETSFDADAAEPKPEFTEIDLVRARDAGFEEGRDLGYREAAAGEERRLADTMVTAGQRVDALAAELDDQAQIITRRTVEVAMTICRKLLPTLARRNAASEVEGLFAECLEIIRDEAHVVVRVPAELAEPLQGRLEAQAAAGGFHGKLVFVPDDDLAPTDCTTFYLMLRIIPTRRITRNSWIITGMWIKSSVK